MYIVVHLPVLDILQFLRTSSIRATSAADSQTSFAHGSINTRFWHTISRYVETGVQEVQIHRQI